MGMISENGRLNNYNLSSTELEGIVKDVLNVTPEEAIRTMNEVKQTRAELANKWGETPSGARRALGNIPPTLEWYMNKKYPGFWKNQENVRRFFQLFPQFRITEKI